MQPAEEREHLRILASYGGIYDNAKLQATVEKTVNRLVAASERPDLKYKVTILNSPAINAFALPNGHLYVTRGLIALANDKAELASVLAHEMGHVIARHAAIREDQARAGRPDQPRGQRRAQRSADGRDGARQVEAHAGRLLARAGIRGRRHRRRHFGARRFRSVRRFALPRRHAAQCRSQGGGQRRGARARLSDHAIRRRPSGSRTRSPMRASSAALARANAIATNISAISTACPMARIRARASCAAAASCIPSSALPSWRRPDSRSTIPRRPCSASRAATRRCGSTWSACRPSSRCPTI